jgi:hypothetical protein
MWNPSDASFLAIYANHVTHHMNVRTYLMAGITCITVIGFALVAFTKGVAPRLIGYCEFCRPILLSFFRWLPAWAPTLILRIERHGGHLKAPHPTLLDCSRGLRKRIPTNPRPYRFLQRSLRAWLVARQWKRRRNDEKDPIISRNLPRRRCR